MRIVRMFAALCALRIFRIDILVVLSRAQHHACRSETLEWDRQHQYAKQNETVELVHCQIIA